MIFDNIVFALGNVFAVHNLIYIMIGTMVGMFFGAMPGLTVTLSVALLLPFTFGLDPASGILMLTGVYCAGTYAGSITAILINTPGTPSAVATCWDGYPLTRQGRSYEALSVALNSSVLGGLISAISLLFFAPQIAKAALQFGPAEKFALTFFGLTVIARVSGKSLIKGLVSALFGLLIATVGMDPVSGIPRFAFGRYFLYGGIGMIEIFIGLFAIAEIFRQIEERTKPIRAGKDIIKRKIFSWMNIIPYCKTIIKSSIIGIIIGVVPGTGGSIASFIAYDEAKRSSKEPELYGQGSLEAVAASESANNGVTAATLIPALTLGIPGNTVAAVFLGALMIHGMTPGPQLFVEQGGLMYTLMIGFIIANLIMYLQGLFAINWFDKVISAPPSILLPTILVMCLVGAYTLSNSIYSCYIALFAGVVGYLMQKFGYPNAPMVIAIILEPMVEQALRQSLILSDGSPIIFLTRPISLVFILLSILVSFLPPILKYIKSRK